MTFTEILQSTKEVFETIWSNYIALSSAHPLLDITSMLTIVGIVIGIFSQKKK